MERPLHLVDGRVRPERVYDYGFRYDEDIGICYQETAEPTADAVQLDGRWYLPHRRHLRPDALRAELERAGFEVVEQDGGNVIAVEASQPGAPQQPTP